MSGEKSQFTSDRRTREESFWAEQEDWEAGTAKNVDVTVGGLVGRVPTQTGETPDSVVYGFENGDVSNWSVSSGATFSASTQRALSGSYSGYVPDKNDNGAGYVASASPYEESVEWSSFSYSFNETSDSYGHVVRLFNGSDNEILRFGSSNITAEVYHSSGRTTIDSGWADYDEWITFDTTFDWDAGTFSVTATDGSSSDNYSGSLINTGGIDRVEIWCGNDVADYRTSAQIDDWFDDFEWQS